MHNNDNVCLVETHKRRSNISNKTEKEDEARQIRGFVLAFYAPWENSSVGGEGGGREDGWVGWGSVIQN